MLGRFVCFKQTTQNGFKKKIELYVGKPTDSCVVAYAYYEFITEIVNAYLPILLTFFVIKGGFL